LCDEREIGTVSLRETNAPPFSQVLSRAAMAATRATSVLLCGCLDGLWAWFDASVGALSGHPKSVTLNGRTYRLTLLGEG